MGHKSYFKVILISIILIGLSQASNRVKGYVYDGETGYAVPGVQIFLSDSSKGVTTDNSGYFNFSGLKNHSEITLKHVKYHPQNREISFDDKNEVFTSYYLYSKNLELDSIVVWGDAFFPSRNTIDFNKIQSTIYSENYKQYLQMLKRKNWSWQELVTYSMWTILEQDYFVKYWNLKSKSERELFLDLFWQKNDPTPNTKQNEFRDEFERRIRYNWTHFSDNDSSGISPKINTVQALLDTFIGSKTLKKESEDRLRPWSKRAPWDARGTVYLKYGEPTSKGISNSDFNSNWNQTSVNVDIVNWYYSKLDIDFDILSYTTNIFKNAIKPGEKSTTYLKGRNVNSQVELNLAFEDFYNEYIKSKIFIYDYTKVQKITDLKFFLKNNNSEKVNITFSLEPEYFRSIKDKSYYSLISAEYKIVNKNNQDFVMRKSSPFIRTIKNDNEGLLEISLPINLDSGHYFVDLKIEDHNSGKKIDDKFDFTVK